MADLDDIPGPGEPGFDPDLWEECEEEQEGFLIFFGKIIIALISITLVAYFFWFLEEHKRKQKEKSKKPEKAEEPTSKKNVDILEDVQTKMSINSANEAKANLEEKMKDVIENGFGHVEASDFVEKGKPGYIVSSEVTEPIPVKIELTRPSDQFGAPREILVTGNVPLPDSFAETTMANQKLGTSSIDLESSHVSEKVIEPKIGKLEQLSLVASAGAKPSDTTYDTENLSDNYSGQPSVKQELPKDGDHPMESISGTGDVKKNGIDVAPSDDAVIEIPIIREAASTAAGTPVDSTSSKHQASFDTLITEKTATPGFPDTFADDKIRIEQEVSGITHVNTEEVAVISIPIEPVIKQEKATLGSSNNDQPFGDGEKGVAVSQTSKEPESTVAAQNTAYNQSNEHQGNTGLPSAFEAQDNGGIEILNEAASSAKLSPAGDLIERDQPNISGVSSINAPDFFTAETKLIINDVPTVALLSSASLEDQRIGDGGNAGNEFELPPRIKETEPTIGAKNTANINLNEQQGATEIPSAFQTQDNREIHNLKELVPAAELTPAGNLMETDQQNVFGLTTTNDPDVETQIIMKKAPCENGALTPSNSSSYEQQSGSEIQSENAADIIETPIIPKDVATAEISPHVRSSDNQQYVSSAPSEYDTKQEIPHHKKEETLSSASAKTVDQEIVPGAVAATEAIENEMTVFKNSASMGAVADGSISYDQQTLSEIQIGNLVKNDVEVSYGNASSLSEQKPQISADQSVVDSITTSDKAEGATRLSNLQGQQDVPFKNNSEAQNVIISYPVSLESGTEDVAPATHTGSIDMENKSEDNIRGKQQKEKLINNDLISIPSVLTEPMGIKDSEGIAMVKCEIENAGEEAASGIAAAKTFAAETDHFTPALEAFPVVKLSDSGVAIVADTSADTGLATTAHKDMIATYAHPSYNKNFEVAASDLPASKEGKEEAQIFTPVAVIKEPALNDIYSQTEPVDQTENLFKMGQGLTASMETSTEMVSSKTLTSDSSFTVAQADSPPGTENTAGVYQKGVGGSSSVTEENSELPNETIDDLDRESAKATEIQQNAATQFVAELQLLEARELASPNEKEESEESAKQRTVTRASSDGTSLSNVDDLSIDKSLRKMKVTDDQKQHLDENYEKIKSKIMPEVLVSANVKSDDSSNEQKEGPQQMTQEASMEIMVTSIESIEEAVSQKACSEAPVQISAKFTPLPPMDQWEVEASVSVSLPSLSSEPDEMPSVTTAPEIESYAVGERADSEIREELPQDEQVNAAPSFISRKSQESSRLSSPKIDVDIAVTTPSPPQSPGSASNRKSSVLEVLGTSSLTEALMKIQTLQQVSEVMRRAGLQSSNLIFGIDYTASNKYQGENSFGGRSLHSIDSGVSNPYQQVIRIMGKTLAPFATSGYIPAFGFGDVHTSDWSVFPLKKDCYCSSFDEVLEVYNRITPKVILSGPTNFAPLILQSIDICRLVGDYHILVIVADGQVTNERATRRAIVDACKYPLSIIVVGVGDGPWDMMRVFDESLPKRPWDNFHFVEFGKIAHEKDDFDLEFAIDSLLEIPDQYKKIKKLGLLNKSFSPSGDR